MVGAITPFPCVRIFCLYTGISVSHPVQKEMFDLPLEIGSICYSISSMISHFDIHIHHLFCRLPSSTCGIAPSLVPYLRILAMLRPKTNMASSPALQPLRGAWEVFAPKYERTL